MFENYEIIKELTDEDLNELIDEVLCYEDNMGEVPFWLERITCELFPTSCKTNVKNTCYYIWRELAIRLTNTRPLYEKLQKIDYSSQRDIERMGCEFFYEKNLDTLCIFVGGSFVKDLIYLNKDTKKFEHLTRVGFIADIEANSISDYDKENNTNKIYRNYGQDGMSPQDWDIYIISYKVDNETAHSIFKEVFKGKDVQYLKNVVYDSNIRAYDGNIISAIEEIYESCGDLN